MATKMEKCYYAKDILKVMNKSIETVDRFMKSTKPNNKLETDAWSALGALKVNIRQLGEGFLILCPNCLKYGVPND